MEAFRVDNYKKKYNDMNITEADKEEIKKVRSELNDKDLF